MKSFSSHCSNNPSSVIATSLNLFVPGMTRTKLAFGLTLFGLMTGFSDGFANNSFSDKDRSAIITDHAGVQSSPEVFANVALSTEPNLTVRFANPVYDCDTYEYCVDVEFQCDEPDRQLYDMNVRFFYDDNLLEFIDFRDFQGTYGPITPNPASNIYTTAGVPWFNFSTGADNIRGAIQKLGNNSPIYISTTGWTKIFQVCFNVDEPVDEENFCPSLVWDLEADPANGGFIPGSEGVVMSVVEGNGSANAFEHVSQFNWQYIGDGAPPFGEPIQDHCLSVNCGTCSLVVSSTADSGAGSLREKVACASPGDTITFASSMGGETILLTSTNIDINKHLYIRSNLSNRVKIKSTVAGLFVIQPGKTVEFKDLDLTSGLTMSNNEGAAFKNSGVIRLLGVKVFKNTSLPTGQYLIRNKPGSELLLYGNCFIEIP